MYYKYWDGHSNDDLVFGISWILDEHVGNFVRYYGLNCNAIEGVNKTEYTSWTYDGHVDLSYGTELRTFVRSGCPLGIPRGWHKIALEKPH